MIFPSGSVVKNPPSNARDMGSYPGLGRSHMPWSNEACAPQNWACALKPGNHNYWSLQAWEPILCSKRSHCNQKPTHTLQLESSHPSPQLEKNPIQQWRPSTFKNNIYTMEYYSAIKKNTFESVLMRWMKLEPIIQSEVSQKEKQLQYTNAYIWNLERW